MLNETKNNMTLRFLKQPCDKKSFGTIVAPRSVSVDAQSDQQPSDDIS
jgi:hypothetical protein